MLLRVENCSGSDLAIVFRNIIIFLKRTRISIFPIIGEELGLIASLIVVSLYGDFIFGWYAVARQAQDHFGRFLAHGIAMTIALQALINFAG